MAAVARDARASVLEVHLQAHDLHRDRDKLLATFAPLSSEFSLVLHQPEWASPGAGPQGEARFFLNPAAAQEPWRAESSKLLRGVTDAARRLGAEAVVVHPGGIEVPGKLRGGTVEALRRTLSELRGDVPVYLENMPWFYSFHDDTWGRSTLGRFAEELAPLDDVVDGFCLDTCHAYLATREGGTGTVEAIVGALARRVRHVHVSGARVEEASRDPGKGEGLPLDEGTLPLSGLPGWLAKLHPDAAVVPEIRDGHRMEGLAFRKALSALRPLVPR